MAEQTAISQHNDEQLFLGDNTFEIGAFIDELVEGPNENLIVENNQTNISRINLEDNSQNLNVPIQNSVFGNPTRVPVRTVPPSPYFCTGCQTIREIQHYDGMRLHYKLMIHGILGKINHAVQEKCNYESSEVPEYCMFDFCQESICRVKQFLVQYCEDREREGFIAIGTDPLSNFYDAMYVGLGSNGNPVTDVSSLPQTSKGNDIQLHQAENMNNVEEGRNGTRVAKSHIASQRERTKKLKLKDMSDYFHLTLNEASKELKLCASAIKRICRKGGMPKWPNRQIKKHENRIEEMKVLLNSDDPEKKAYASSLINEHKQYIASYYDFCAG